MLRAEASIGAAAIHDLLALLFVNGETFGLDVGTARPGVDAARAPRTLVDRDSSPSEIWQKENTKTKQKAKALLTSCGTAAKFIMKVYFMLNPRTPSYKHKTHLQLELPMLRGRL